MARRRYCGRNKNTNAGINILSWILALGLYFIFDMFQTAFKFIVWVFSGLVDCIPSIVSIFKSSNSSNTNRNRNHVKHYGLMDNEMDEVKKGNYVYYNFEEEDLEDDDYYNDDLD
jgi:hypothetical protein